MLVFDFVLLLLLFIIIPRPGRMGNHFLCHDLNKFLLLLLLLFPCLSSLKDEETPVPTGSLS